MTDGFPLLAALGVGFVINALDISCTLLFAAKPWEAELRRQGLKPRNLTPPWSDAYTNLSDHVRWFGHRLCCWRTGAQCAAGFLDIEGYV
jgi:hypothetical protein